MPHTGGDTKETPLQRETEPRQIDSPFFAKPNRPSNSVAVPSPTCFWIQSPHYRVRSRRAWEKYTRYLRENHHLKALDSGYRSACIRSVVYSTRLEHSLAIFWNPARTGRQKKDLQRASMIKKWSVEIPWRVGSRYQSRAYIIIFGLRGHTIKTSPKERMTRLILRLWFT